MVGDYLDGFDHEPTWDAGPLPHWSLPSIETDPTWGLDFQLPEPEVSGYGYSLSDQAFTLEVWIEKSTMNDVLVPVCDQLGINLVAGSGFESITQVVELLAERVATSGRPTRIWYLSDFDPSGDHMAAAVARQLEWWRSEYAPESDIKLQPLGLTREQVERYQLPRVPTKENDHRAPAFEERNGAGAVELDALEALYPGELARLVREAVAPYFDAELATALSKTGAEAIQIVGDAWTAATDAHRTELDEIAAEARRIAARYQVELSRLEQQLQAELAPVKQHLDDIRERVQQTIHDLEVTLPERPQPKLNPPDESTWLFDARRAYLEHLHFYKQRRSRADGLAAR